MDYKYLLDDLNRYEELWDKASQGKQAVGKAQRWHWFGLNEGFKFAMKTIRDIIRHGETIEKLINKLSNLEIEKIKEKQEIERKAQIKVLEEIRRGFAGKPVVVAAPILEVINNIENIFIKPIEKKLKQLKEDSCK